MLPPNSGYYGVAVWGSSPSIDVKRRLVFIATGGPFLYEYIYFFSHSIFTCQDVYKSVLNDFMHNCFP